MLIVDLFDRLVEGLPPGGLLYHGSDVMSAARILIADEIRASTEHNIWLSGASNRNNRKASKTLEGVSLTRSFRFAVDWKGGAGVVFQLDGSALRGKAKLTPVDYYQDRREAEEFVIGSIKPLSSFLTVIHMSPETRDYCIEHDAELVDGHKDYEELLAHPLLKVSKFPAQTPYVNPRTLGATIWDGTPPDK